VTIDRAKYMNLDEVGRLRKVTEAFAVADMAKGRVRGVLAWAVVDVALSTGLRVSEIARLRCGDVDFKRGCLRVTRSKKRRSKSETLAVGADLLDHLREFIAWKEAVGQTTGKVAPLFVGKRGALTVLGLQRIWKRAVEEAGLPADLSIHSARHTIAVTLLKKTGNLRLVQKQLGHASPTITANMYADVAFEDMQAAVNGLYDAPASA
jgi:integrase